MGISIQDGTGTGLEAKISNTGGSNRLFTFSLIEYPLEAFTHEGKAYTIPTDFIALTTTVSYSGILYLFNSSDSQVLHIQSIRTSSTVNTQWQMIKNPTSGTLITAGTVINAVNSSFSSGKTLSASIKKAASDGQTITDGTLAGQWMTTAYNAYSHIYDGSIALNINNSIAIQCKPTAAGSFGCTLILWHEDNDEMIG